MTSLCCEGMPACWNVWCRRTSAMWSRLNRGRRATAANTMATIGVNGPMDIWSNCVPLPVFDCSGEPDVPRPCARWIRVARQRWSPTLFDPVVRQWLCRRRHLARPRWHPHHTVRHTRYFLPTVFSILIVSFFSFLTLRIHRSAASDASLILISFSMWRCQLPCGVTNELMIILFEKQFILVAGTELWKWLMDFSLLPPSHPFLHSLSIYTNLYFEN